MNGDQALQLLHEKVYELGQTETARRLKISPSAVNQLLHGKYKASPKAILTKVTEVFGGLSVQCPVLGTIPLVQCSEEKKRPFTASSNLRVRLFRACRECSR